MYHCVEMAEYEWRDSLVEASINGDLERVKYLCERKGYPFPKTGERQSRLVETPLHEACR